MSLEHLVTTNRLLGNVLKNPQTCWKRLLPGKVRHLALHNNRNVYRHLPSMYKDQSSFTNRAWGCSVSVTAAIPMKEKNQRSSQSQALNLSYDPAGELNTNFQEIEKQQ